MSIKGKNKKLNHRIARIIMDDEMTQKHQQKQKLKKDILSIQLKSVLHIILYFVLLHKADLPEHNIDRIKTKLRSVCEKYHNVKTPYKHRAIINNLLKNKDIVY